MTKTGNEDYMKKVLDNVGEQLPVTKELELIAPLSNRMLFWPARFLAVDPVLHQIPLLLWVVDVLRPRSIVTLGNGSGVAHFALCQAVDKLDYGAVCYALGPWPGGGIPDEVVQHNENNYQGFSYLRDGEPESWTRTFSKRAIDFLFLDLEITPEVADKIENVWLPRLSEGAVVMLHGLSSNLRGKTGEALLARLQELGQGFELEAGDGIALVLLGNRHPDRLKTLAQLSTDSSGYSDVQRVMSRLGRLHYLEAMQRQLRDEIQAAAAELAAAEAQKTEQGETLETLRARFETLDAAYDARNKQLAALQSKAFDTEREHRQALAKSQNTAEEAQHAFEAQLRDNARLQQICDGLTTEQERLQKTLELAEANAAELLARQTELENLLKTRGQEIEQKEKEVAAEKDRSTALRTQLSSREAELAKVQEGAAKSLEWLENRKREVEELKARLAASEGQRKTLEEAARKQEAALQAADERVAGVEFDLRAQFVAEAEAREAEYKAELAAQKMAATALRGEIDALTRRLTTEAEARKAEHAAALADLQTAADARAAEVERDLRAQFVAEAEAREAEHTAALAAMSVQIDTLSEAKLRLAERIETKDHELAQLTQRLEAREASAQEVEESHARALAKVAVERTQHALELETVRRKLTAAGEALEQLRAEMRAAKDRDGQVIAALRADAQAAEGRHAEMREQRFVELAQLTTICEAQERQLATLQERTKELESLQEIRLGLERHLTERQEAYDKLTQEHHLLVSQYQALQGQYQALREQVEAILLSNSWKVTAPVRRIIDILRGSKD